MAAGRTTERRPGATERRPGTIGRRRGANRRRPGTIGRPRGALRLLAVVTLAYLLALAANRSLVAVAGPSMEPALWEGDRLLTVPVVRRWVRDGRLVVVRDPARPDHLVVKRVAAIEGDRVTVLGDAPDRSTDSRTWGSLPVTSIRRVVIARWPDVRTPLTR